MVVKLQRRVKLQGFFVNPAAPNKRSMLHLLANRGAMCSNQTSLFIDLVFFIVTITLIFGLLSIRWCFYKRLYSKNWSVELTPQNSWVTESSVTLSAKHLLAKWFQKVWQKNLSKTTCRALPGSYQPLLGTIQTLMIQSASLPTNHGAKSSFWKDQGYIHGPKSKKKYSKIRGDWPSAGGGGFFFPWQFALGKKLEIDDREPTAFGVFVRCNKCNLRCGHTSVDDSWWPCPGRSIPFLVYLVEALPEVWR